MKAAGFGMRRELPPDPSSARLARRVVEEACGDRRLDLESIVLCASELVTNALLHGAPPIAIEVDATAECVRVAVSDGGLAEVRRRRSVDPEAASGRGLGIVEALATRWGAEPTSGGKVTWFEIVIPS